MQEENVTIRRLGADDYDELLALWQRSGLHPLVLEAGLHSLRPQGRDSRASIARQLASTVQPQGVDQPAGDRSRPPLDARHAGRLVAAAEEALHEQGMYVIAALTSSKATTPPHWRCSAKRATSIPRCAGSDPGIHYLTKRDSDDT